VPDDISLEQVQVGVSSRQEVADAVGRPSASGLLNDEGWYYVQSKFKHLGPFRPEETDRQVVAISFDDRGIVENVERFGLQDGQVVPLSRRVTESNIKGVSFLRQLFSSFGRLRASDILDN
jgi:outer membrane protein assembly factor BamE (lipoprotein component of BamABCDE complex)